MPQEIGQHRNYCCRRQIHYFAMKILILNVISLIIWDFPALAQQRRVALVVGSSEYLHLPSTDSAASDAIAIARSFRELGFDVQGPVLNPTTQDFFRAIFEFESNISNVDIAVFYYAGHGISVNNTNYLLPVDLPRLSTVADMSARSINMQQLLRVMISRARNSIIILDACRDNPFDGRAQITSDFQAGSNSSPIRSAGGLSPIDYPSQPERGAYIVFSAQPGRVAYDRLPHEPVATNSLFARYLLQALARPPIPLPELMQGVRDAVAAAARRSRLEQVPHLDDRMPGSGEVRFVPKSNFELAQEARSIGYGIQFRPGSNHALTISAAGYYAESIRLFRLSANEGDVRSIIELGTIYLSGWVVDRNIREAERYFLLAANSNAQAAYFLGSIYSTYEEILDYEKSVHYYRQTYILGGNSAVGLGGLRGLADAYEQGRGVRRDPNEALRLWRSAARLGDQTSQEELRRRGLSVYD